MVDLRRVQEFLVIAELGTVTAAAERLHIAQPALSRHLSALEHELGLSLFTRERGRLHLTIAGRSYRGLAQSLVDHASRVDSAAGSLADGRLQRVVIAAPMATLNVVIAPFVASLGADEPIITGFDHPALRPPEQALGRADLVVGAGPASSDLGSRSLGQVPLCAQVAPSHRFAREGRQVIDVAELTGEPLVLQSRDNLSRVTLDAVLAARGLTASIVAESEVELMVQAVAASGRGVGVLTERTRFGLHAIRLVDHDIPIRLALVAVWERNHYAAAELERLAGRLADSVQLARTEIATDRGWGEY